MARSLDRPACRALLAIDGGLGRPSLHDGARAGPESFGEAQAPDLGEDDGFQKIEYAERFAAEIPNTRLVRIPKSGHIPTENDAPRIAREMIGFFKG